MRIFIDITSDQSGDNFVPATVQNLQASLLSDTIQVSWDEFIVSNGERDGEVNMYRIERKVNEGAWQLNREFEEEDWATGFLFSDLDIEAGNTYYYRIKAFTTKGKETDWSNEVFVEVEEEIIFNPPSLSLELKPTGIQVTWVVDPNNTIPTTNNQSEVIKDSEAPTFGNLAAGSDTALYSTVVEGSTYKLRIRSYNEDHGYSEWSDQKTIVFNPAERGTVTNVTYSSVYGSGQNFGYKQYVPSDYDGNTAIPLVIWLHGLGERSQSNGNPQFTRLELYGPFKEYKDFEADYPFLMIAPQQPTDVDGKYTGRGSWDVEVIEESLNHFKSQGYNIDLDRVYITGQSMGGGGVLSYINSAYGNDTIAAALPIATTLPQGTGIACNIKHIPIWIFHAENDSTVPSSNSKNLYTAIKACTPAPDVEPKITIFDLSGHVGWNQVYRNTGAAITDYADNSPFPNGTTWEDWLLQYSLQSEVSPAHKELVTFSSSTFPNETCKYYKYLPEGYDEAANESLYCFIMLHGLGEFRDKISGTEADKDAGIWQNGPAKHIYNNDDLETIGIAPHVFICPQQPYATNYNNDLPSDNWNFNYLAEIYNIVTSLEKVDPNKIIITGLSMGAKAAQRYASLNPEKIYKCLVVAPNWHQAVNEVFAHQVPLWVVHGNSDTTSGGFGISTSRTKIIDIMALDPTYPPRATFPTGVGHDAWTKTYNGVGWSVPELSPDPNGGAGVDPIGNPDNNPYVWATTGDKTNIIS